MPKGRRKSGLERSMREERYFQANVQMLHAGRLRIKRKKRKRGGDEKRKVKNLKKTFGNQKIC